MKGFAQKYGCALKPLQQTLTECKLPILGDGSRSGSPSPRSGDRPDLQSCPKVVAETPQTDDEIIADLRESLAAERKELRRVRKIADDEIARARKAVEQAAALRRQTQQERAEVAELRQQVDGLQQALQRAQERLRAAEDRHREPLVDRLPYESLPVLRGLVEPLFMELVRRKNGGRKMRR